MSSTYIIEPQTPGAVKHDVVVAKTDGAALREARRRCSAGTLYRFGAAHYDGFLPRRTTYSSQIFVARFFAWEAR